MKNTITIIINPTAGDGKKLWVFERVKEKIKEANIEFNYFFSKNYSHAKELATEAAKKQTILVACGGDGHVGNIADIASQFKLKFGIIPTGTGNDFANDLGIVYDDIEKISSTLILGNYKLLDLGQTNNKNFCSIAGVGFSSEANEWANKQKFFTGKYLYIASVIRTIITYKPKKFFIIIDDKKIETFAWLVAVANSRSFGGKMIIAPDACMSDGLLDLVIVGPTSHYEFLKTFPKVFSGKHTNHPSVSTAQGKNIKIYQDFGGFPSAVYADGERYCELPAEFSISKKSLIQLIPKKS